uniref:Uncharacterized protein n=1 Tax=Sphaerodactylus townsendi TaxID=933632 RepID=A0ACB8EHA2_9SAUR
MKKPTVETMSPCRLIFQQCTERQNMHTAWEHSEGSRNTLASEDAKQMPESPWEKQDKHGVGNNEKQLPQTNPAVGPAADLPSAEVPLAKLGTSEATVAKSETTPMLQELSSMHPPLSDKGQPPMKQPELLGQDSGQQVAAATGNGPSLPVPQRRNQNNKHSARKQRASEVSRPASKHRDSQQKLSYDGLHEAWEKPSYART